MLILTRGLSHLTHFTICDMTSLPCLNSRCLVSGRRLLLTLPFRFRQFVKHSLACAAGLLQFPQARPVCVQPCRVRPICLTNRLRSIGADCDLEKLVRESFGWRILSCRLNVTRVNQIVSVHVTPPLGIFSRPAGCD